MRSLFAFFVVVSLACGEPPAASDAGVVGGSGGGSGGGTGGAGGSGGGSDAGTFDAGTPDAGVAGYPSIAAYCAEDNKARCARWMKCGLMTSQALCTDLLLNKWRPSACSPAEVAAVKDGRMAFDGVAGKLCHDSLLTRSCLGPENYEFGQCTGVFKGLVPNGGSCITDNDCSVTGYCSSSAMTCPATCLPRKPANTPASRERECAVDHTLYEGVCEPRVAMGSSCAPKAGKTTKRPCVEWGYCNASNLCVDDLEVGGACPVGDECRAWLRCNAGTCAVYGAQGAACGASTCKWDLFCTATAAAAGTCTAPVALGTSCRNRQDCAGEAFCLVPAGAQTGTCTAIRMQGGACTSWEQCKEGLSCIAATCQPARKLGQSCGGNDCDVNLTCSGQSCVRLACFDDTP